jgi:hypothetical protein
MPLNWKVLPQLVFYVKNTLAERFFLEKKGTSWGEKGTSENKTFFLFNRGESIFTELEQLDRLQLGSMASFIAQAVPIRK